MTTKPQIYAIGTCAIGIHASFLKTLSIYYYYLFFLLNSVAKKIYEILASNFDKLCETNPIIKRIKMNVTKALTTDYENKPPHNREKNKPNLSRRLVAS